MSDPRNLAHAKKVTQEKKHHVAEATPQAAPATPPEDANPAPRASAALEGSLVVLAKLKELEFHSRAHLERIAELNMTIADELKQKGMVGRVDEVYSAQSLFQTKLTALIEAYQGECDRMHAESV